MAKKRTTGATGTSDALVREALEPHGFPTGPGPGLCFRAEDDALYARGYPYVRFVTDEPVAEKVALKSVEKALDAIDPVFGLSIPRAIVERYLRGYSIGPGLFVDRNHPSENATRKEERAERIRSDRAIDRELLVETLERLGDGMGRDTYASWRMPKVLHLYEHYIGAEVVARVAVDYLLRQAHELGRWGFAGEDPYRTNAMPHHVALALPWILRRVPESLAAELRRELGTARDPDADGERGPRAYFGLLRWLADPSAPPHESIELLRHHLALLTDDAAAVSARLERLPNELFWYVGRSLWLLGTERLAGPLKTAGHLLPRMVDEVAPLRDPGVVRLIAKIATQRAGKVAAGEWLRAHRDYAAPILRSLAALEDPKEKQAAESALELVGAAVEAPRVPTQEEHAAEIARIFGELGTILRAGKDRDAEVAAIREAYERYTEARAAIGDPIPEAYFTHHFGEFDLGQWAMLAVDAID